jgi:quinolinate synthase
LNHLQKEINELKKVKNAIILAHNYQPSEIQDIADFIGDSLELCLKATDIEDKDIVIFCGVDFMAETAYILNPDKKIILPNLEAECPMAHMLPAEELKLYKELYPDAAVVLYVNTLAEAKAMADILCTSANAVEVVESLPQDEVLFGPDINLAWFVANKVNKKIIPIPEDGHCFVHKMFSPKDVILMKEKFPTAEVLAHPECTPETQEMADHVLSTGGMVKYVASSDNDTFLIETEVDMVIRLKRENPDKIIIPLLEEAICDNMKLHTLESVKDALINEKYQITVPDEIAQKARRAVERMLEVSR